MSELPVFPLGCMGDAGPPKLEGLEPGALGTSPSSTSMAWGQLPPAFSPGHVLALAASLLEPTPGHWHIPRSPGPGDKDGGTAGRACSPTGPRADRRDRCMSPGLLIPSTPGCHPGGSYPLVGVKGVVP